MRLAIISDTHFGDNNCTLVKNDTKGQRIVKGPKYNEFRDATGIGNDYLVLAGDIFDFSIASYEKSYAYARNFFKLIRDDNIAQ